MFIVKVVACVEHLEYRSHTFHLEPEGEPLCLSGPSLFFLLLLDSPLCPWQEELEEEETYTLVTCGHAVCSLT